MKSWFASKTIWFNVITLLITVIGQVTNAFTLNANTLKVLSVVLTVGNILLRLITTQPIGTGSTAQK